MVVYRSGYATGSSVLQSLESAKKIVGNPVQHAVSITKVRRHIGRNHTFCGFSIYKISR